MTSNIETPPEGSRGDIPIQKVPKRSPAGRSGIKRAEDQYRILVMGVTDYALFMLDREGKVASWNSGAERLKGWQSDEIIGAHFSIFYTEEDRVAGKPTRVLEEATSTGRFAEEAWRVRRDGTRFWASVVLDAIYKDDGQLVGFAKITRDMTDRLRATSSCSSALSCYLL